MFHFFIWVVVGSFGVLDGRPEWHLITFAGLGMGMWIATRLDEIRDLLKKAEERAKQKQ